MPEGSEFIVLADETLVGWIKFNGPGEAPDRHMGLLFDGFQMPERDALGELDKAKWELGLATNPRTRGSTSNVSCCKTRPRPSCLHSRRARGRAPSCRQPLRGITRDVLDPDATDLVEETLKDYFDGRGIIPTRFGKLPKRALIFRASEPFPKMVATFESGSGERHEVEILGDGQQLVVAGVHPDTGEPYTYHGQPLWDVERADLVEVTADEMQDLLGRIGDGLATMFGWKPAEISARGYNGQAGRHDAVNSAPRAPVDVTLAPGPRPLSWQSLGCEIYQPASPWGGWLVLTRSHGSEKCGSPRQIG